MVPTKPGFYWWRAVNAVTNDPIADWRPILVVMLADPINGLGGVVSLERGYGSIGYQERLKFANLSWFNDNGEWGPRCYTPDEAVQHAGVVGFEIDVGEAEGADACLEEGK